MERESMEFDVVVVGGGPAGLSAAIRLKQLALAAGNEVSVCLLEKSAEIGGHILSGTVMDPRAMNELFPDWKTRGAPLDTPVSEARFLILGKRRHFRIPNPVLPTCFHNDGNFLLGLGELCRWLAQEAEALGVEICPGFAANEILLDENGAVIGVVTGDSGRLKDGSKGPGFQSGMALLARYTLFAEGCRGHLGKQLEARFGLREGKSAQVHGLGIKELWEIDGMKQVPGLVIHTGGWPMDAATYGGGFIYHMKDNLVSAGLVTGLNYANPFLSPFHEFQRLKTHPALRPFFEGGKRIAYGARALVSGGLQSLPKLVFPGGALVGDDAGFMNAARIKGVHCAIKSGMLLAESCHRALCAGRSHDELVDYPQAFSASWLFEELHRARNFKPWMARGRYLGGPMFGVDQAVLRGKAPWTLNHHGADHASLKPAKECRKIDYPKPDGEITFDRMSSVWLSGTQHGEEQPCHLKLKDETLPITVNLAHYDAPEQRYCPAGVYEIVCDAADGVPRLQINAQNCLHCKACDIKDPCQNITWTPPQGGEGPNYPNM